MNSTIRGVVAQYCNETELYQRPDLCTPDITSKKWQKWLLGSVVGWTFSMRHAWGGRYFHDRPENKKT
ncbi:hypothetical protein BDW69DRAFT_3953 [Aspergillus filifer]